MRHIKRPDITFAFPPTFWNFKQNMSATLSTPPFIGSGSATSSLPPSIGNKCSLLLPAFVPTSATSGPGGGGAFFPTRTETTAELLDVFGRVIPCSSPLIYMRFPASFIGRKVQIFADITVLRDQPLMCFVVSSRAMPISGMYASDFNFSFPSPSAGIVLIGGEAHNTFEAFQLTWRRPVHFLGCSRTNSLQEFVFVRASHQLVIDDDGNVSAGDASKLVIDTLQCEPSNSDTTPWQWIVVCSMYEDLEASIFPGAAEESFLQQLLDEFTP